MKKVKPTKPGPGQESVWDYPRPPKAEAVSHHVRIVYNDEIIADSNRTIRVLETSHPPVYYIPQEDVKMEYLTPSSHKSFCEFKGMASYFNLEVNGKKENSVAWCYPDPGPRFVSLKNYMAVYPSRMEACYVNDEKVQAQEGDFYGGWITSKIVGPFKGGAGTWGW